MGQSKPAGEMRECLLLSSASICSWSAILFICKWAHDIIKSCLSTEYLLSLGDSWQHWIQMPCCCQHVCSAVLWLYLTVNTVIQTPMTGEKIEIAWRHCNTVSSPYFFSQSFPLAWLSNALFFYLAVISGCVVPLHLTSERENIYLFLYKYSYTPLTFSCYTHKCLSVAPHSSVATKPIQHYPTKLQYYSMKTLTLIFHKLYFWWHNCCTGYDVADAKMLVCFLLKLFSLHYDHI